MEERGRRQPHDLNAVRIGHSRLSRVHNVTSRLPGR